MKMKFKQTCDCVGVEPKPSFSRGWICSGCHGPVEVTFDVKEKVLPVAGKELAKKANA